MADPSTDQMAESFTAGEIMEYDVSEIRLEDAETGVESQEVVELSTEFLGQVGGGNGGVIL